MALLELTPITNSSVCSVCFWAIKVIFQWKKDCSWVLTIFVLSWRCDRDNYSHRLPILGWHWRRNWVSPIWCSSERYPPSSGTWPVWILLFRTLGFSKHIFLNGGALTVSICPPVLVSHALINTLSLLFLVKTENCRLLTWWYFHRFSFTVVTLVYAGVAVSGFMMFGESTMSQFTLNLPQQYIPSKIAIWMTVRCKKKPLTVLPLHSRWRRGANFITWFFLFFFSGFRLLIHTQSMHWQWRQSPCL